jgi:site-specific recombinase XerD
MTGARISEISRIKIENVKKAMRMENPSLLMFTSKKGGDDWRYVPVLLNDLNEINTFILTQRTSLIDRNKFKDNGFLFISEKNGKPLTERTLTNDILRLRRAAGINSAACAHMFRHRFITKLFISLIKEYELKNESDFRRALLDVRILKQRIQQYTGHSRLSSLDHYIDLAFNELSGIDKVVNTAFLRQVYDRYDELISSLSEKLRNGMSVSEYLDKLEQLRLMKDTDVIRFSKNEDDS